MHPQLHDPADYGQGGLPATTSNINRLRQLVAGKPQLACVVLVLEDQYRVKKRSGPVAYKFAREAFARMDRVWYDLPGAHRRTPKGHSELLALQARTGKVLYIGDFKRSCTSPRKLAEWMEAQNTKRIFERDPSAMRTPHPLDSSAHARHLFGRLEEQQQFGKVSGIRRFTFRWWKPERPPYEVLPLWMEPMKRNSTHRRKAIGLDRSLVATDPAHPLGGRADLLQFFATLDREKGQLAVLQFVELVYGSVPAWMLESRAPKKRGRPRKTAIPCPQ